MQAVSQLNNDNTDILCHSQEHLSQVLCLYFQLICRIRQLSQLGNTIYQKCYLISKFFSYLFICHNRILYHIVEYSGYDCLLIQFQIRQNNGNT